MKPCLTPNSQSCLSLLSAGIAGVYNYTLLRGMFLKTLSVTSCNCFKWGEKWGAGREEMVGTI
jgi:hypothetical protein